MNFIYDIVAILEILFCILSEKNWTIIIYKNKTKLYIPPAGKKRHLNGMRGFAALTAFCFGMIINGIIYSLYRDPFSAIFGILACIVLYFSSIQFLYLAKEKEISIKDAISENSTNP